MSYEDDLRAEVYEAIDGEREYQKKWDTAESSGKHETGAFILFMEYYLQEARRLESILEDGGNSLKQKSLGAEGSLDFVRKVTALGVACMEQNGIPERVGFER